MKVKVVVNGACGRMGSMVSEMVRQQDDMELIAGVTRTLRPAAFPLFDSLSKLPQKPDVILDFSSPEAISDLVKYAGEHGCAIAVGTTGLEAHHREALAATAKAAPVFVAPSMSLGVSFMKELVRLTTGALDCDVEIVEDHNNEKRDAPSGTALMLAAIVREVRGEADFVFSRAGRVGSRRKNEVGIHSVRAGGIIGGVKVIFGCPHEVLEIRYQAVSRAGFAGGAVEVARFMASKPPGYYTMDDLTRDMAAPGWRQ